MDRPPPQALMPSAPTQRQIDLVRAGWRCVEPIADDAARLFYTRLFELDPAVRPLFHGDLKAQGRKLMTMIGTALRLLDRPAELLPAVRALGRRHAGYGVRDAHYATVGAALLWTLERGLGAAFTPQAREAWSSVYAMLATTMRQSVCEAIA